MKAKQFLMLTAATLMMCTVAAPVYSMAEEAEHPRHKWKDVRTAGGGFELECEYRALVDNNGTDMMFYPAMVTTSQLIFYTDERTLVVMSDTRNLILQPGGGGFRETVRELDRRC